MAFNRINHFLAMINSIGQIPELPADLINTIRSALSEASSPITICTIRKFMKQNRINLYYEHVPFIYNHLSGISQVNKIPDEIKPAIISRFTQIVRAHRIVFNGHRSFFNHHFILTKILKEMQPFQNDIEILSFLDENKIKSVEKMKSLEADWNSVVDIMICPLTPSRLDV